MPLQSMTGFARETAENDLFQWSWEIRSVNGKGLDLRLKVSPGWERLDPLIRGEVQKALKRGSLFVNFEIKQISSAQKIEVNQAMLNSLVEACRTAGEEPRIDRLLGLRGVLENVDDGDSAVDDTALQSAIMTSLTDALGNLQKHRAEEGQRTAGMLSGHLDKIETLVAAAKECAGAQPDAIRAKIQGQIDELLTRQENIDEQRLAQEAALLAVKADIREEIDRLGAHIKAGRDLLAQGAVIGRKLDFLCQEFNREANTLCSKSSDIKLTQMGLDLKATIDQLREQTANIE